MNFRNNFFQNNNVPGPQGPMDFNSPNGNFNPNMNNFNHPVPNNNMAPDFAQQASTYPPRFNAPVQPTQAYGYENPNQAPGGNEGYYSPYRRSRGQQYRRPSQFAPQYDANQNQNYSPYQQPAMNEPAGNQFPDSYGNEQYNAPARPITREQYSRLSRPIAEQRRKLAYNTNVGNYDEDSYNYDDYYDEPSVREEDSRSHKSRFFTKLAAKRKRNDDVEEERDDRSYSRREDDRRERKKATSRRDKYEDKNEDEFDDYDDEEEEYEEKRRPSRSKKLKKRAKSRYEDEDEDEFDDYDNEEEESPKDRKKGFLSGPVDFFKKKKRG